MNISRRTMTILTALISLIITGTALALTKVEESYAFDPGSLGILAYKNLPKSSDSEKPDRYNTNKEKDVIDDFDHDGLPDEVDPNPDSFDVTTKVLSLASALTYENYGDCIGQKVGEKGSWRLRSEENYIFKDFEILDANDSGDSISLVDEVISDFGLAYMAIKLTREEKNDIIIFSIRGTEINENVNIDAIEDILLGLGTSWPTQSKKAFKSYQTIAENNPDADIYITGHSLGGRIVQDIVYEIYDKNDGYLGLFKSNIKTPKHACTFNGLGYNSYRYVMMKLLHGDRLKKINNTLYNYYIEKDMVGHALGNSFLFKRIGKTISPWKAKDGNGIAIESDLPYEPFAFHRTFHFYLDDNLNYDESWHE